MLPHSRKNFSEAKIMVKVLSADEFDATGARKAGRSFAQCLLSLKQY